MEEFKSFEEITTIDERHKLMAGVTGGLLNLKLLHKALSVINLNKAAPEDIRNQFNVAKNMALYSYFSYSIAPEVHMKTYSIIEHALRERMPPQKRSSLYSLLNAAIDAGLIQDKDFRHIPNNSENPYTKSLSQVLPKLRNTLAHGTNLLVPDCVGNLEKAADLINQLFKDEVTTA